MRPTNGRGALVEWAIVVLLAVAAALLVKTYAVQAFWIPSPSMEPTLVPNDRVLVDKLAYDFHPVREGDIVVFRRPPGDTDTQIGDLIKRVIGLPGETVLIKDCAVYVDGHMLASRTCRKGGSRLRPRTAPGPSTCPTRTECRRGITS